MSDTMVGAKVETNFADKVLLRAATLRMNKSDYLRNLIARDLGFSSYTDYLHIVEETSLHQNETQAVTVQ